MPFFHNFTTNSKVINLKHLKSLNDIAHYGNDDPHCMTWQLLCQCLSSHVWERGCFSNCIQNIVGRSRSVPRGSEFPGVGTLELSNPPGWGREKRANAPSSASTVTFFIDRTVEYCRFKHFNVRFFVSINVLLCNSARILIKTSCRDDMHQFIILVVM